MTRIYTQEEFIENNRDKLLKLYIDYLRVAAVVDENYTPESFNDYCLQAYHLTDSGIKEQVTKSSIIH